MTTLRELKNGALLHTVMALWMIGEPAKKQDIRRKTGWSDEAVQDALDVLSTEMGLVLCLPDGRHPRWALTAQARQMLLPLNPNALEPGTNLTPLAAESDLDGESLFSLKPGSLNGTQLSPLGAESAGGSSGFNIKTLNLINTTTTTELSPPGAESDLIAALKELGCSETRATQAVSAALSRGEAPEHVAKKIADGKLYLATPRARGIFQQGAWLAACVADGRGVPAVPAPPPDADPESYDGYMQHAHSAEDADKESESTAVDVPAPGPVAYTPAMAWHAALGQLRLETTKAVFDTWLRGAEVVDYADGLFTVAVQNKYQVDWLTNRLLGSVKRTLSGLVGQSVDVRFVTREGKTQ